MSSKRVTVTSSDTRRRTVAPTTLQSFTNALKSTGGLTNNINNESDNGNNKPLNSIEYLDKIEEELNRKVDGDVEVLVEGMAELVRINKVSKVILFRSIPIHFLEHSCASGRHDVLIYSVHFTHFSCALS